ncbi:MFS family permease [Hamadaea flava]|uniref:MFS transporter n=1 Tax=Hamadaea flava TaxID=1742688 RepID=A0ABV8LX15_9ACTN|nr:MFS transporter [Hamadaea flava]MCP2329135.1 MFS family permease [Hamadaea flava]
MQRVHRLYTVVVFVILASLDNVAAGLVPPLYSPISSDLHVPEAAIAAVTATGFLVSAVVAVGWAYAGDHFNRRWLLMAGTTIWAAGTFGTAQAQNYGAFFAGQLVAAVGLGAVGSVGFSVVSDLISPRRRGLIMSLFGLSQGVGTLAGTLMGGVLGAEDWRRPFTLLAVIGLGATAAYLPTASIRRGQSEPALKEVFEAGGEYDYRISRADLPKIARHRTNIWLVLQGVTAQLTFGSLVWLPRLLQAKAEAQGYPQDTAIVIGTIFATIFQLGGALSIIGGLVGDRLQRRTPRGRALVAAVGVLAGIPFYVILFFLPLQVDIAEDAGAGGVTASVLRSLVTEPLMGLAAVMALIALALSSANSPNWFALIADVNLPEHRGTVYSVGNLANGVGRAAGNSLVGVVFSALSRGLPPPWNYATGLALFQVFFLPTGVMYWLASKTSPRDIADVDQVLHERAEARATAS